MSTYFNCREEDHIFVRFFFFLLSGQLCMNFKHIRVRFHGITRLSAIYTETRAHRETNNTTVHTILHEMLCVLFVQYVAGTNLNNFIRYCHRINFFFPIQSTYNNSVLMA
jgi:DNA phosphorothioation-dependent restriction protein DptG